MFRVTNLPILLACLGVVPVQMVQAQIAVRGETVYTMAGPAIENGVVLIEDGKIAAVGTANSVAIPSDYKVLDAKVVTPGLVDAHATVGLTGILNIPHDQDQIEHSAPIQPELRALDAYNIHEPLVEWVRSFGVTTVHTGHAPGELISGQTIVVKTFGNTVEEALVKSPATVAATLSPMAKKREKGKSPGTRGKMMALLRAEFIKAGEYLKKREKAETEAENEEKDESKKPGRDLSLEMLGQVLNKEVPLMITANRAQDIASALRLAKEFDLKIFLDSGSESYMLIEDIKAAGIPVIIHPTMTRAYSEMQNMSFETAAKLREAGIRVVFQSGYESYVPKTRVLLFEAALAAAHGLKFEDALAAVTIEPARMLGVDDRVGSLEVGKDGDVALYDGDPFEYTTHCIGVIGEGEVVSEVKR